nr:cation transporter [Chloroflexota bacterium]
MTIDTGSSLERDVPVAQEPESAVLNLEGMTCASCAMRIEKGLKKVPGVTDASVNLATERATVVYDPRQTGLAQMVQKVEAVGYKATPQAVPVSQSVLPAATQDSALVTGEASRPPVAQEADERSTRRQAEIVRKRRLLILSIALTLPVVLLSMFFMNSFAGENYVLLALTTPVWAFVGWEFHRGAINTLRHGAVGMDTLVSIGSTAAYLLSVVATFFPGVVGMATFYDTAALIITLIFLGRYLEARAKGQTGEAIKRLAGLQPRTAHVMRGGQEIELPIEQVQVDAELIVRPGEKIPVDGTVLAGRSAVDEAMITG